MDQLRISATSHAVNYLPEYHAVATGGFTDQELTVHSWDHQMWTGVLDDLASGAADVALGGLWVPAMYAGVARDLVVVGQLNGRFPMVLVTREHVSDFDWSWMKGRIVFVPGAGGTAPYEFTAGLMREHGADPAMTRFVRDLPSDMLTELFIHGSVDAMVCDVTSATWLAQRGAGVATYFLAEHGGPMPNSVYYVRKDRLSELHNRLVRFMAGIAASMSALNGGTTSATVDILSTHWPDIPIEVLKNAAGRLIASNTWSGIRVEQQSAERWVDILRHAGLVVRPAQFEEFVDMSVVDEAEQLTKR